MREIPTTRGYVAVVDDADYERLAQIKWHAVPTKGKVYARNSRRQYMHRLLMNAPKGLEVDHQNGSGMDNQRHNLRLATHKKNLQNRTSTRALSGHRGVRFDKKTGKYRAIVTVDRKTRSFGYHFTVAEAARAAEAGRILVWGPA